MSTLKVNTIQKRSGSAIAIGESGDTVTLTGTTNIVGNTAITGTISSTGTTFGGNNDNYFQAYRPGTNASPSANTWTAYVYNSTLVNNNSVYDTSSGEFTVPADGAGRYFFHSQFWASQIDDGESAEIAIWDDISGSFASSEARTRSSFGFGTGTDKGFACKVSCILDLSVGDKVKTYVKVTSGGIFANSGYNYFLGYKLA
tara:strand:- start:45 stop:647 length:603 start_codon:yes stop_codon:yes gene_type:complete